MNRLWVRISLSYAIISLLALVVIGLVIQFTFAAIIDPPSPPPPEVIEYYRENNLPVAKTTPLFFIGVVGLVAVTAGVYLGRTLASPLAQMAEAAKAIGKQDFSQRIEIKGTQEVEEVATAFNEMAAKLEQEESLRQSLLADVAHELRHPVHLLQGNLQAILDDVYPLNKEEIARLFDQTQHLNALVNDLHILAQAEAQQLPLFKDEIDIVSLVKETTSFYQSRMGDKNIDFRIELLGTMPDFINIDGQRIRQVIQNLLDNSIRHTDIGGNIYLSLENKRDYFLIILGDDGAGLSPEQLPFVFERFYQTDEARSRDNRSTGLGLAITKAIIDAHDGSISVSSPGIGQGSVFTITLPQ